MATACAQQELLTRPYEQEYNMEKLYTNIFSDDIRLESKILPVLCDEIW